MKNVVLGILVSVLCGAGYWSFSGKDGPPKMMQGPTPDTQSKTGDDETVSSKVDGDNSENVEAETEDQRMSRIVPGVWETNREGRRILTVKEDGTAIMDVTVEGMSAYIVGSKMKFNIKWKIEDGSLDFEMIDGEPQTSVDAVIKLYGKQRVQKILEFTEKKFVLKDNDGEEDHVWVRIEQAKQQDEKPSASEPAKAGT